MGEHSDDLKFVVTSVPFVAEVNERSARKTDWFKDKHPTGNGAGMQSARDRNHAGIRTGQMERACIRAPARRDHRAHCANDRIEHLVFLTGDMHCCYHATMRIGERPEDDRNRLSCTSSPGGPVNQLQLGAWTDVRSLMHRKRNDPRTPRHECRVDYEVTLDRFHGEVNAVMHVKIDYVSVANSALDNPASRRWSRKWSGT